MKHLTKEDRTIIEDMLNRDCSITAIAKHLERSPSTISREIRNHLQTVPSKASADCIHFYGCRKTNVCGSSKCKLKCRQCHRCTQYCVDYKPNVCTRISRPPYVCNGCEKSRCLMEKRYYKATPAQISYETMLKDSRSGFALSDDEMQRIDQLVLPLVRKGQSPYHICQTLKGDLAISESTLRRLIASCQIETRNIDLRNQVKRKVRVRNTMKKERITRLKEGHRYQDYLDYQMKYDMPVVEMDCVEGSKEDHAVLLTLHFVSSHMQLAYRLPEQTSAEVVLVLDWLENTLGPDIFRMMFPLILTDNGSEFADRISMERSLFGGKRTTVFYCEPNRSDEKGHCEKNHTHIRYVIPKGQSLATYEQKDISKMMDHINSYRRKSLYGKSPYELAMDTIPEDFFEKLQLHLIPPDEVILKPYLLS